MHVEVLRPGRTIELVQATLSHAGRPAVLLRAWLLRAYDTVDLAGSSFPTVPGPDDMPVWDPDGTWPASSCGASRPVAARRSPAGPRPGSAPSVPLVGDEPVSATARALGLIDIANGLTPRRPTDQVAFPNVDLTVHLVGPPRSDWLGFDTTVTFGPTGLGLTHTILHDTHGPLGVVSQSLTVRPRPS